MVESELLVKGVASYYSVFHLIWTQDLGLVMSQRASM